MLMVGGGCQGQVDAPEQSTRGAENTAPVADAGSEKTVSRHVAVTLDGSASSDADGDRLTFKWEQTAGPSVTLYDVDTPQPWFYAPDAVGTLTFSLVVDDGFDTSPARTVDVVVVNTPPVADAGPDQTVPRNTTVLLDGLASADPDPADTLTYAWTQTGGPPVELSDATSPAPLFTTKDAAVLSFELVVSDGLETSGAESVTVTVASQPPVADAGPDQTVARGATVTLDGSSSFDPDSDLFTFQWTQTSGVPVALSDPEAAKPSFLAPVRVAGTLTFELVVDDGEFTSSADTVTVTLQNDAPVVALEAPTEVNGGELVYLDATGSSDPDGDVPDYQWTQTAGPRVRLSDPSGDRPAFQAPNESTTLTFELQLDDGGATSDVQTASIEVVPYAGPRLTANVSAVHDIVTTVRPKALSLRDERLYVTTDTDFRVYDVGAPTAPTLLGTTNEPGCVDIALRDFTAYLACGSSGVVLYDVASPATSLDTPAGSFDTDGTATALALVGNTIYVADGANGLVVLDGSSAANITELGQFATTGNAEALASKGDVVYVTDDEDGVHVVDVSQGSNPNQSGLIEYSPQAPRRLLVEGSRLYAAHTYRVDIYDVSTADAPVEAGSVTPPSTPHDLGVVEQRLFVASGPAGIVVYDVADLENTELLGDYPFYTEVHRLATDGQHAFGALLNTDGIELVDVSTPSLPAPRGAYAPPEGSGTDVAVERGRAYYHGGEATWAVDVSEPSQPELITSNDAAGGLDLLLHEQRVYAASYFGFAIYDIRFPEKLTTLGTWRSEDHGVRALASNGDHVFVAHGSHGMGMVDVSDPNEPVLVGHHPSTNLASGVATEGTQAYLTHGYGGALEILDVSDPESIDSVGSQGSGSYEVVHQGDHAYVAGSQGFSAVDVSAPSAPSATGGYHVGSFLEALSVHGPLALVGSGDGRGVLVVDLRDPENLVLAGRYDTVGSVRGSDLHNHHVYAALEDGLWIFDTSATRLDGRHTTGAPDDVLAYTLSWKPSLHTLDVRVDCQVSAGSCAVTNVDQDAGAADVTWTLPASAGEHALLLTVGNLRQFTTLEDRVTVQ